MVSEQVIPEEGVNGEEPPIQLKMRKENSVLEKDHHPLTKGSPNKRFSQFKKAGSMVTDMSPSKFGFGNTGTAAQSVMSRTSKMSTLMIDDFVQHTQSVSQVM